MLSRRSTGLLEGENEFWPSERPSLLAVDDDLEDSVRLSARLLDYNASFHASSAFDVLPKPLLSARAMHMWNTYLSKLSNVERGMFLKHSKSDLGQYVLGIEDICRKQGDASKGRKVAKLFRPLFRTMNLYAPVAQTLVQADPTPSALILGGITSLMDISERYLDYQEEIVDMLSDMGKKIPVLIKYGSEIYENNDAIQEVLIDIFGDILQFCSKAYHIFRDKDGKPRSSAYTFMKALAKSFRMHFGDIIEKFEKDLQYFEERARLCDREETKDFHSLSVQYMRHQMMQTLQMRQAMLSMGQQQMSMSMSMDMHRNDMLDMRDGRLAEAIQRQKEQEKAQELKRKNIITWLRTSSVQFHKDQNERILRKLSGTGGWILEDTMYAEWKGKPCSELLWVKGKRGCGKSFLASVVVEEIKTICESPENMKKADKERTALAYIYCNSLEADKIDPFKLLCSVIEQLCYQLTKPTVDTYLEAIYDRHGESRPIDTTELRPAIDSLLGRFKATFIVVDGLDELCALEPSQFESICGLLKKLTDPRSDEAVVKLVVFSRPEYAVISNELHGCPTITIDSGANQSDIEIFTTTKLQTTLLYLKRNPEIMEDIRQDILSRAEGMFLWADLVINSLQGERVANKIRQKIQGVPGGLDQQYKGSLERILVKDEAVRTRALRALLWITNARRPLKRPELLEALVVEPGMTHLDEGDRILDDTDLALDCSDLILVDPDGCYRLIHSSLKDYLTSTTIDVPHEYRILQENAETILGVTCITYLLFEQFENGPASSPEALEKLLDENPFLEYASVYWGKHVASTGDAHLHTLTKEFVTKPRPRNLSMQFLILTHEDRKRLFKGPSTPLHILSMFELVDFVDSIPGLESYQTTKDGFSALPLDYALTYGNRRMCNRLLAGLKDLHMSGNPPYCRCYEIHSAVDRGWAEVVKTLIDLNYDPQIKSTWDGTTPLHAAAIRGSLDVLEVLLQAQVDINARDLDGSTPLLRASEENNSAAATQLIKHGANANLAGWKGTAPLHHAAKNGALELTVLLLQHGADKDAVCDETWGYRTASYLAAQEGSLQVLEHLIREGANFDKAGPADCTPFLVACINGHADCAAALARAGANLDATADDGKNAFHIAADLGHLNVLQALLPFLPESLKRRLMDDTDNDGCTPLHYAAINGYVEIALFLIKHGASPNVAEKGKRRLPIHEAISRGEVAMAKSLLDHDRACIKFNDISGSSALHYIAYHGSAYPGLNELVALAIQAGADPEAVNDVGIRAIHFAAEVNNLEFIKMLLEQVPELDLNPLSKNRNTPLFVAATASCVETVDFLLDRGVPVQQPKSESGNLPIHRAAWHGNLEIVKKLLTRANINEPGYLGRTALYGASVKGHIDVVEYLLKHGADPDLYDQFHNTPLLASLGTKHIQIANLLLDHGADAQIPNLRGFIPLHEACRSDDVPIVRRLLLSGSDALCSSELGETPFRFAVNNQNPKIIDLLLEHGFDGWHMITKDDYTNFHALVELGDVERLRRFQHHFSPADVTKRTALGETAFHFAAGKGHSEMFQALVDLGLSPQRDGSVESLLHLAASSGFIDAVRSLLDLNVDVNEQEEFSKRTALHMAAANGLFVTAEVLIEGGADMLSKDAFGLTFLDYAMRRLGDSDNAYPLPNGNYESSLDVRIPCLRETSKQMLQKLLSLPDELGPRDQYDRLACVDVLSDALLEMRTPDATEKVLICNLELFAAPDVADYYPYRWECRMCSRQDFARPKYLCSEKCGILLCDGCHREYDKGDEMPKSAPKSFRALEKLEIEIKTIRQALSPYIHRGSCFVLRVCEDFRPIQIYLEEKQKEYEEWLRTHNYDGLFDECPKVGMTFLKLLQTSSEAMADRRKKQAENEKAIEVYGLESGQSQVDIPLKPETERNRSDGDLLRVLDQDLLRFFRENRADKEIPLFRCSGHNFLEIPTFKTATAAQLECLTDKKIRREWLQKLKEWLEQSECDPSPQIDPESSSHPIRDPSDREPSIVAANADAPADDRPRADVLTEDEMDHKPYYQEDKVDENEEDEVRKQGVSEAQNTLEEGKAGGERGGGDDDEEEEAEGEKEDDTDDNDDSDSDSDDGDDDPRLIKTRQRLLRHFVRDLNAIVTSDTDSESEDTKQHVVQPPGFKEGIANKCADDQPDPREDSPENDSPENEAEAEAEAEADVDVDGKSTVKLRESVKTLIQLYEARWRVMQAIVVGKISYATLQDELEAIAAKKKNDGMTNGKDEGEGEDGDGDGDGHEDWMGDTDDEEGFERISKRMKV